jgi:hypothetical protein
MPLDQASPVESRTLVNTHAHDSADRFMNEFQESQMMRLQGNQAHNTDNKQALTGSQAVRKLEDFAENTCKALGFGTCELFDSGKQALQKH